MSNVSRVNGLRPIKYLNGSPWNGAVNVYAVLAADSTAIFVGDPVTLSGSADVNGVPSIAKMTTASTAILGVVVGFIPEYTNLNSPQYRLASTARYALVVDDPNVVFEAQTSNGTVAVANIGLNVSAADAGGSTTTGLSGVTMDIGTVATTAALTYKLLGVTQRVDNSVAANAKVLVSVNNHVFKGGTGTLGL